jgi:hypothetical protein
VVEGAALEMLFRGNFNEGSNPSLSVKKMTHARHGSFFLEPIAHQNKGSPKVRVFKVNITFNLIQRNCR